MFDYQWRKGHCEQQVKIIFIENVLYIEHFLLYTIFDSENKTFGKSTFMDQIMWTTLLGSIG